MDLSFDAKLHQRALKRMPIIESELYKKLWALVDKVPELEKEICELWDDAITYGGEAKKLQQDYDEKFKQIFDVHGDLRNEVELHAAQHLDAPAQRDASDKDARDQNLAPNSRENQTPLAGPKAAATNHDLPILLQAYGAAQPANEASWPCV